MTTANSMSVAEAIANRHSVRSFSEKPITDEQLDTLFQAARLAPSSLNSQPWRFKATRDRNILNAFGTKEVSRTQSWLAGAGAIIACCADITGYVRDSQASAFFFRDNNLIQGDSMEGIEEYVSREAASDEAARFGAAAMNVGIAISFMMLRAVELGLGTCWVGMFDEGKVKELLEIENSASLRIVGIVAVGHPAEGQVFEHKRKGLDEIVLA